MNDNSLLDVDESILAKKLLLPGSEESHEMEQMMKKFDQVPFIVIQPAPGLCVKTKTDSGEKTFINVCMSNKIPPPEDISDARLLEILDEDAPSFTIPMSIGTERLEADKGGAPCATYDVVINTTYFDKCQKNKVFWMFTISVIIDGVSQKSGKRLSGDYVTLKNRKVMGKLQEHRIQNREAQSSNQPPKLLIEEISRPAKTQKATEIKDSTKPSSSQHVILKEPAAGSTERLIGLFQMPKNIASKDVAVLLDPDRIVVAVEQFGLTYDVSVPYTIKTNATEALLDRDTRVLRLNMPVIQT